MHLPRRHYGIGERALQKWEQGGWQPFGSTGPPGRSILAQPWTTRWAGAA